MMASVRAPWLAFHFHYHGRQNHLLEHLVRPLVGALLKRREIDSFFFVRFALGGPHVRLRLRLKGSREIVTAEVEQAAERFFSRFPSTTPLAEEEIRKASDAILATDPTEREPTIYPDNSWHEAPFQPEVGRYGGARLLPESLAFFALSSCRTLRFLHRHQGDPGSRLLSFAYHLLGGHALGFAEDVEDLFALVRYPVKDWEAVAPLLVERGDQTFEQRRNGLLDDLRRTIEDFDGKGSRSEDTAAARGLGRALGRIPARRGILRSQLHMTSNRLGLKNGEEVYVARLLWRAASELVSSEPSILSQLERCLREGAAPRPAGGSLENLLPRAFDALAID